MNLITPTGFKDFLFDEAFKRERITASVQSLLASAKYKLIETPTLEVMDVVSMGASLSMAPFKFYDNQGQLLAMRPDATRQIARIYANNFAQAQADTEKPVKFRYTQRIFREQSGVASTQERELTQIGIECIGDDSCDSDLSVISLFIESLKLAGLSDVKVVMGTVAVLHALLDKTNISDTWKSQVLKAYHNSDFCALDFLCSEDSIKAECGDGRISQENKKITRLISCLPYYQGDYRSIKKLKSELCELGCQEQILKFEKTYELLMDMGYGDIVSVDFSVITGFDYYTGVVFEAYSSNFGSAIGSGGRYDNMLRAYGVDKPACGFAFYLDFVLKAIEDSDSNTPKIADKSSSRRLRIAIPKGSLFQDSIRVLKNAGLDTTGLDNPGRQLIISNKDVDYIIVRPTDAPVFVSLGAADCGMCGKDSLLESDSDVVDLMDLEYGECRFVVAKKKDDATLKNSPVTPSATYKSNTVKVATKYPNITKRYYDSIGIQAEILKLHGNIELAPLTGLAQRVVDITATGTTLRENNLEVEAEILSSTAHFFANKSSYRTNSKVAFLADALKTSKNS